MQSPLFDPLEDPPRPMLEQRLKVRPCPPDPALQALATALPHHVYIGTSSWTYPGWAGLVWDQAYAEPLLSKHGLAAYSQHPLMRTVSLDRTFYRPLSASQYAAYAAQVPDDFRFVVKAPSIVTDAMVRAEAGRAHALEAFGWHHRAAEILRHLALVAGSPAVHQEQADAHVA